jgi:hypothetical protein
MIALIDTPLFYLSANYLPKWIGEENDRA